MSRKTWGLLGVGLSTLFAVYVLLNLATDVIFFFSSNEALYLSLAQVMGIVALIIIFLSVALAIKNRQWGVVVLFFILLGLAFIYAWHISQTSFLQFAFLPIMMTENRKRNSGVRVNRKLKWLVVFIIITIAVATLVHLRSSTMMVFLGAFIMFLGILLLNKGRKETVNLKTDITPIAFAFVVFTVSLYYAIIGYTIALPVAIVMIILMFLLYAVI